MLAEVLAKWNPIYCWWECELYTTMEFTMEVPQKKLKYKLPCDTYIPHLGLKLKESKSSYCRDTHTPYL